MNELGFSEETLRKQIRRENIWFLVGIALFAGWLGAELFIGKSGHRLFLASVSLIIYTTLIYFAAFRRYSCPKCGEKMTRLPLSWRSGKSDYADTHKFACAKCGFIRDTHIGPPD